MKTSILSLGFFLVSTCFGSQALAEFNVFCSPVTHKQTQSFQFLAGVKTKVSGSSQDAILYVTDSSFFEASQDFFNAFGHLIELSDKKAWIPAQTSLAVIPDDQFPLICFYRGKTTSFACASKNLVEGQSQTGFLLETGTFAAEAGYPVYHCAR